MQVQTTKWGEIVPRKIVTLPCAKSTIYAALNLCHAILSNLFELNLFVEIILSSYKNKFWSFATFGYSP